MATYLSRYLEPHIRRISRTFPVLLVTGARQVGKTTLLRHLASGSRRHAVSLDEFGPRSLARSDPERFLEQYPPPLLIDEVQHAPELLPAIKAAVDRNGRMGAYWLTGSQEFRLMRGITESLAGRVGIVRLLGVSWAEEHALPLTRDPWTPARTIPPSGRSVERNAIFRRIIRGSFPRLLHRSAPALDAFYGSYVQTYIDRDLRDLVRVGSLSSFERFVRLCATRTASLLNLSDLARDSDVSVNTAKAWLSLLEASGQVFLLRPYHRNAAKRLVKAPKLYALDTGLACYLTGWRDSDTTARGAFAGQLFETFVVGEILRSFTHRGLEPRCTFYRTKDGDEVDILIERDGRIFPVEVKLTTRVTDRDARGIDRLDRLGLPIGSAAIVALVREPYVIRRGITVVPPSAIG